MKYGGGYVYTHYKGSKRKLENIFLELNSKNVPDFDKLKASIITEYGIDVDDPLDSTYELMRSVITPFFGDSKHHIYMRIHPDFVQFATKMTPEEEC